ncbi:MAG TPA: hypothetical protein VFN02_02950, partial [Ktedonobacteraceae bacterium]|nr:hypothetical protein [Ktedonobacteraceae bacterium]
MEHPTEENPLPGEGTQEKARRRGISVLGQRWLTAIIAMPIVLAFALLGGWFAFAGVTAVVALGTY